MCSKDPYSPIHILICSEIALYGDLNEAWSHDNKPCLFLLSGVIACIQTKMPAKRGISSSNFVVIRSEYF